MNFLRQLASAATVLLAVVSVAGAQVPPDEEYLQLNVAVKEGSKRRMSQSKLLSSNG